MQSVEYNIERVEFMIKEVIPLLLNLPAYYFCHG